MRTIKVRGRIDQMVNSVLRGVLWLVTGMVALFQSALPIQAEAFYDKVFSQGQNRRYLLDLPDGASRKKPLPTVVVLHSTFMNGAAMREAFGMATNPSPGDIAVAYPDGTHGGWDDGLSNPLRKTLHDVKFLQDLARDLIDKGVADAKRLYLVGFSIGGVMTYRVACYAPDTFAAYAAILASMPTHTARKCPRDQAAVPMLIMSATDDEYIPWQGGLVSLAGMSGAVLSTDETVKFWRNRNKCNNQANISALPDKITYDGSRVLAFQYVNCRSKTPVVFMKIQGGGHQLPGVKTGSRLEKMFGKANRDISAADIVLKFFRHFPLQN